MYVVRLYLLLSTFITKENRTPPRVGAGGGGGRPPPRPKDGEKSLVAGEKRNWHGLPKPPPTPAQHSRHPSPPPPTPRGDRRGALGIVSGSSAGEFRLFSATPPPPPPPPPFFGGVNNSATHFMLCSSRKSCSKFVWCGLVGVCFLCSGQKSRPWAS